MRARIIVLCIVAATFLPPAALDAQDQGQSPPTLPLLTLRALVVENTDKLRTPWIYGIGEKKDGRILLLVDKRHDPKKGLFRLDQLRWKGITAPRFVSDAEVADYVDIEVMNQPRSFGAMMGSSTSNSGSCYSGTLGFTAMTEVGKKFGYVTANHVAAASRDRICPNIGNAKRQVSPSTGMHDCHSGSTIGQLEPLSQKARIDFTGRKNYVDAAFVTERGTGVDPHILCNDITWSATTIAPDQVTTDVLKCGAATKRTVGSIVSPKMNVKVRFQCGLETIFWDQIIVKGVGQRFAYFGDSGALVVTPDEKVVGLLFGGDETFTWVNPIGEVLSTLGVKLCPVVPCQ